MGTGRKSIKRKNRTNNISATQQRARQKARINKLKNQPKDLTFLQKIGRYKKWFPVGIFLSVISFYYSFWPKNLDFTYEILGVKNNVTNGVVLKNPNEYSIKNVIVRYDIKVDLNFSNGSTFSNIGSGESSFFREIESKKSKHITPHLEFHMIDSEITKITRCSIVIKYSYDTPFFYPSKSDYISLKGMLNERTGEVKYLPN